MKGWAKERKAKNIFPWKSLPTNMAQPLVHAHTTLEHTRKENDRLEQTAERLLEMGESMLYHPNPWPQGTRTCRHGDSKKVDLLMSYVGVI
ncbi:hypothetical protein CDAR_30691 [Caerostris darwini]|uniref:Uncharacterized protein n=1 Tax=Caerostris darwini TaxID=1538125 RepID=A0AAV4U4M5_9ARAC|nr:hypothetical protein CDAR_30691 [Caerostris darwini]